MIILVMVHFLSFSCCLFLKAQKKLFQEEGVSCWLLVFSLSIIVIKIIEAVSIQYALATND